VNKVSAQAMPDRVAQQTIFQRRRCGVLLPNTALPVKIPSKINRYGAFDSAYQFIDWAQSAGITVWQLLPLGPTQSDRSPYLCLSSLAGNTDNIGLHWLQQSGLLKPCNSLMNNSACHAKSLEMAYTEFTQMSDNSSWHLQYHRFCAESQPWLDNFALFMALRSQQSNQPWNRWPTELRDRHAKAVNRAQQTLYRPISRLKFYQFLFFKQWAEIRQYAHSKGIFLFGDMPLFVAYNSADVWANRRYFKLEEDGLPLVVAGVPPDYFSPDGQRWGNPHYNWQTLQEDDFSWWIQRIRLHLQMYDLLRIDHFRGLESAWEIPASSNTAKQGHWQTAPGAALLDALIKALPNLPLVAEDLGLITPEVIALRHHFRLPGMAVLQFAFDSDDHNPYLPHNLNQNTVLYTGTHDNDTSLGWYLSLSDHQRTVVTDYLQSDIDNVPEALIEAALASVARLVVLPLQDMLRLNSEHRTNTPGTTCNNWLWHFEWPQLSIEVAQQYRALNYVHNRCD